MKTYDLAIIGLGAMGAAAVYQASQRGISAVAFEQFDIGHERSSSGGRTRIFRLATKEGAAYIPTLRAAQQYWQELDRVHEGQHPERSYPLFAQHGGLIIGPERDPEVAATLQGIYGGGLTHEILSAQQARERFRYHRFFDDDLVIVDPKSGLLRPQDIVKFQVARARALGADIHEHTEVSKLRRDAQGHVLTFALQGHSDAGGEIRARKVLIAAGPWTAKFLPQTPKPVQLTEVFLHWFQPLDTDHYGPTDPEHFPIGNRCGSGLTNLSFFPQTDADGVKVNFYNMLNAVNSPIATQPKYSTEQLENIASLIEHHFHGLDSQPTTSAGYVESFVPDSTGFITPAGHPDVLAVSGFSGQGFKFSPVVAYRALRSMFDQDVPGELDLIQGPIPTW